MKDKKPFVVELILGLVLAGASFFVQSEYYSILVFAMGFGLSTASATQLIRMAYWQNPKRQEAYQAKQREEHILAVDERMQFLRMLKYHPGRPYRAAFFVRGLYVAARASCRSPRQTAEKGPFPRHKKNRHPKMPV